MAVGVDDGTLFLGVCTPKEKDEVVFLIRESLDDGVGEGLPTFILVRSGLVGADGESGIEEENALVCPALEIACLGRSFSQVRSDFFVDIDKRRGNSDVIGDRKAETIGLTRAVIGVLTNDDDFNIVKGAVIKGIENKLWRGIDRGGLIFFSNKVGKLFKVWLVKLGSQCLFP